MEGEATIWRDLEMGFAVRSGRVVSFGVGCRVEHSKSDFWGSNYLQSGQQQRRHRQTLGGGWCLMGRLGVVVVEPSKNLTAWEEYWENREEGLGLGVGWGTGVGDK
ncbi:UNVERIFIED_CONTAM: hypothetical protein Sindi_2588100 [Sesamum indicum]